MEESWTIVPISRYIESAISAGHTRIWDSECRRYLVVNRWEDRYVAFGITHEMRDNKYVGDFVIRSKYEIAKQINRDPLWGLGNYE